MKLSKDEVLKYIRDFLDGKGGEWDWDDFISVKLDDPLLDQIRIICVDICEKYPAVKPNQYCSKDGYLIMEALCSYLKV